jgi:1-aminocyclopropane-1-carboxylate deaminase/D-cysteine desulfhydrase-like pyridoxal-dependent ACC family enzyme
VAKGVNAGMPDIAELATQVLELGGHHDCAVDTSDVHLDTSWMGDDYAVPTDSGDAAIRWAARRGGWVLDRTYSGKGLAGLLGTADAGRWPADSDVVFVHTGGLPSVFASGGAPSPEGTL